MLGAASDACTAVTLRMHARQKKWPLDGVAAALKHTKDGANDCAECKSRLDRIKRNPRIKDDLSAEQGARLPEVVNMGPVHRTLPANAQRVMRAGSHKTRLL